MPALNDDVSGSHSIFKLPQRLGRYTLTKRLGAGGMAEVFLAVQDGAAGFTKTCVVKRILPHLALESKFVEMFQREAKIAALLTHTNIVQIYELGEVEGVYFIAMEHVDGAPLDRLANAVWQQQKPLPLEVASCAIADAALGLHAAHEQRDADGKPLHLVHRDISPDNLIINRDGVTKILDFGVAKTNLGQRTATGELKGKVPYLSPEQLTGDAVDARADLYALGVTFYWLLTGKRPFHAPTDLALMQLILQERPKRPKEINPGIPDAVDALVMSLLEKDRAKRPSSAADVHDALVDFTRGRRTLVAPFVRAVLERGELKAAEGAIELAPGFLASTTSTPSPELIRTRVTDPAANRPAALDSQDSTNDAPIFTPPGADVTLAGPVEADHEASTLRRSRAPILVGAAAALLLGVGAVLVLMNGRESPSTALSVAPPTPPQPAGQSLPQPAKVAQPAKPALPSTSDPAPAPPTLEEDALTAKTTSRAASPATSTSSKPNKAAPTKLAAKAVETPREMRVTAPAGIAWESEAGKGLGTGTTTLKLQPGDKYVVAYDFRVAGRTKVPVAASVDFNALPRGKLQARAQPFAEVWIGIKSLGTTPVEPADLAAGTYTVRFVYQGREEKRVVEVKSGDVTGVNVDFTR
jgi:serine/threonine-protein kinase